MKLITCFLLITFPTILFAQNIGIGTTEPTRAKLEVHGAAGATSAIFGGESSGISLQRNFPGIGFNQYYSNISKFLSTGYASNLYLDPASGLMGLDMLGSGIGNGNTNYVSRAITVANNGNVSIKSISPSASSLYVARTGSTESTAVFAGNIHKSYFNYGDNEDTYIRAGLDYGTVYINDIPFGKTVVSGRLGINTNTPGSPLEIRQVNSKGLTMVEPSTFNSWQFNVGTSVYGYLNFLQNGTTVGIFTNNGSYSAVSDMRLKKDIQNLPATIGKLMQLRPVDYEMKYNNAAHQRSTGFLAQELKNIFPELVTIHKDTATGYKGIADLHTVNYAGLTPFIIKGVQEQQQEIQALRSEVDELKKTVEALIRASKAPVVK